MRCHLLNTQVDFWIQENQTNSEQLVHVWQVDFSLEYTAVNVCVCVSGTRDMALLRALVGLGEDPGLVPSTQLVAHNHP